MPDDKFFDQFEEPKEDYFSQFEDVTPAATENVKKRPFIEFFPKERSAKQAEHGMEIVAGGAGDLFDKLRQNATTSIGMDPYPLKGLRAGAMSLMTEPYRFLSDVINDPFAAVGVPAITKAGMRPGLKTAVKETPEILTGEVLPTEAAIPKVAQKQLPAGTYHVTPEGVAGVTPNRPPLPGPLTSELPPRQAPKQLSAGSRFIADEGGVVEDISKQLEEPIQPTHTPINDDGIVTAKEDFKLEPQIKQAEIVDELPTPKTEPLKTQVQAAREPEVVLRPSVQEYVDAIKSGKIEKGIGYVEFLRNQSILSKAKGLGKRLVKEEKGTFEPLAMFKKVRGVSDDEANNIREEIISSIIRGGRLDLEGIYGRSAGVSRNQFNKIVDEIIDTGAAGKVAEQVKLNTPEPIKRLLGVLAENKTNRALQDAALRAERSKRFGAFESTLAKGTGKEGFFKAASKMSGEYDKVSPVELELGEKDVQALFDQIKSNRRVTSAEKLRAGFALRDLLEGNRTLQQNELMLMDRIYGPGIGQQIIEMHGGLGGIPIKLAKTANTMKSMQATLDLSAPFRQGLGLVHRKEFWNAFVQMQKYARSHEAFMAQEAAMEAHPNYLLSRDSGLFTADHELGNFEEQFGNSYLHDIRLAGKVGKAITEPAAASERAYVGFLNKLRFDTFNTLMEKAEKAGLETFKAGEDGSKVATELSRKIADYINVSTGRGDLGRFNKYAEGLNTAFFSPRLIASRLQILNPKYYIDQPAFVRKESLKTLLAMGGFIVTANELGKIIGGESKLTPSLSNLTNPDYGKIRFKNTRLDPGGGMLQYITAASQFVTGQATSSTSGKTYPLQGGFGGQSRLGKLVGVGDQFPSFMENKLSPMFSLVDNLLSNRRDPNTGEPMSFNIEIRRRFTPLIIQDLMELYKEDPELLGLGIPAALGMSVQTYGNAPASGIRAPGMNTGFNLRP